MKKIFDSKNWLNIFLVAGFLTALFCGIVGWYQYYAFEGKHISFWTSLYLTLQLLNLGGYPAEVLRVPVLFNIARFLMPLVLAATILKVLVHFFTNKLDNFRIHRFRNHFIFCGFTDLTRQLINDLDKANNGHWGKTQIVVIDENMEPEELYINKYSSTVRLLKGKINEEVTLEKANIYHAQHIVAMDSNDNVNLTIAKNVKSLLSVERSTADPVRVTIKLEDFYNLRMFKDFQIAEPTEDKTSKREIDFHAFDPEQIVAAKIIDAHNPAKNTELLNENAPASHILISGLGSLGQKILIEAAHMYHFPNLKKLKVTLVDYAIKEKVQTLKIKQPFLSEIIEMELIDLEELIQLKANFNVADILVCYVTAPGDSECMQRSLQLRQYLFDRLKNQSTPEIVAILTTESLQQDLLLASKNKDFLQKINIQPKYIGIYLNKKTIIEDKEEVDDNYAKKIYESWLDQTGKKKFNENNGWERLTDSDKDSNRYHARHYKDIKRPYLEKNKCTTLFDSLKKPSSIGTIIGKMEHNRWNAEKLLTGFVKGDTEIANKGDKDIRNRLKYHYCICPWDSLNQDDQLKDIDPTQYLLKNSSHQ